MRHKKRAHIITAAYRKMTDAESATARRQKTPEQINVELAAAEDRLRELKQKSNAGLGSDLKKHLADIRQASKAVHRLKQQQLADRAAPSTSARRSGSAS